MVRTVFESFIKSSLTLAYLLLNLCPTSRIFFVRQEVTSRRSHHVWWLSCIMPSLTWTALSVTLTRGARCFFLFMTPEKDGLSGAWEYLSSCCFQEMLKQIRELRKPRWRRLRKRLLRWCYTGWFATTFFSATDCCNVGTMLQARAVIKFWSIRCKRKFTRNISQIFIVPPLAFHFDHL